MNYKDAKIQSKKQIVCMFLYFRDITKMRHKKEWESVLTLKTVPSGKEKDCVICWLMSGKLNRRLVFRIRDLPRNGFTRFAFHQTRIFSKNSSLGRYVFGSEISYNKAPPRLPGLGC